MTPSQQHAAATRRAREIAPEICALLSEEDIVVCALALGAALGAASEERGLADVRTAVDLAASVAQTEVALRRARSMS